VPIELPIAWVLTLNVLGWPVIQLGLAWLFTHLPISWFRPQRAYRWEREGRFYEQIFAIKRWKDWLPDGAPWFRGGFGKGKLQDANLEYLRRFSRETWRGELCHWCALAFAPVFFLWNPWWADLIMVTYAVPANLPCIVAQRYNRARLQRLIDRRTGGVVRASPR